MVERVAEDGVKKRYKMLMDDVLQQEQENISDNVVIPVQKRKEDFIKETRRLHDQLVGN